MSDVTTAHGPLMLLRPRSMDKRVLAQADDHYQGLHVAANLPTHMVRLVKDLGKPFLADPSTWLLVLSPNRLVDKARNILRPSIVEMAKQYGPPFEAYLGKRALRTSDFGRGTEFVDGVVGRVLAYQKSKFCGQMPIPFDPYYAKYTLHDAHTELAATADPSSPALLIPPYFPFKATGDDWYSLNLLLAERALANKGSGDRISPLLLISSKILDAPSSVARIVTDYGSRGFDAILLWVNDFKEDREPPARLASLAGLVRRLAATGRPVFKLFGGYFSLLLFAKGLRGYSCGIGYGTSKNAFAHGGGKPTLGAKYYVRGLHRSLDLKDAEALLRRFPDLRCGCKVCRDVYGVDMDGFSKIADPGFAESHFLNVRRSEADLMRNGGLDVCVEEMREVVHRLRGQGVDVSSLNAWCDAIKLEIAAA